MNVFLLDVDGVINAVPIWDPRRDPHECPWEGGWDTFQAGRYEITFAPELCEELVRIHDSGLAEVRWLTTWADEANVHLAERFGFPHFEVVGGPPPIGEYQEAWWKFPLAATVASLATKTVWADDDLPGHPDASTWALMEESVLPLTPNHYEGLTPDDIRRAKEFLHEGA